MELTHEDKALLIAILGDTIKGIQKYIEDVPYRGLHDALEKYLTRIYEIYDKVQNEKPIHND